MKVDYKFREKITDDIVDAHNIVRVTGKAIEENKIDRASLLDNLARALNKLESAKYYIDRE